MANFKEELIHVKAFVFDVDGVLTNGNVLVYPGGELLRTSNMRDGYAFVQAIKNNYPIAVITGGKSVSLKERFANIGLKEVYLGSKDKKNELIDFCERHQLTLEDVMYMGDDLPDYEVMTMVGMPVCPYDAVPEIRSVSKYISHLKGGEGCARDVIEQVLKVHGKWFNIND